MNKKGLGDFGAGGLVIIGVIFAIFVVIIGFKLIQPWWQEVSGKADLREAEWSKQVLIEEARATKASASLLAEAEVERAKGIAKANEIIAGSITEKYLKYRFIEGLQTNDMQTIYVPVNGLVPVFDVRRTEK